LRIDPRKLVLSHFDSTPADTRLNFEGTLAYSQHGPGIGYVQLFRNGVIEAVDAHLLQSDQIPIREIERTTINTVVRSLALLNDLGLSSPVQFHISLLGVRGSRLSIDTRSQIFDDFFI